MSSLVNICCAHLSVETTCVCRLNQNRMGTIVSNLLALSEDLDTGEGPKNELQSPPPKMMSFPEYRTWDNCGSSSCNTNHFACSAYTFKKSSRKDEPKNPKSAIKSTKDQPPQSTLQNRGSRVHANSSSGSINFYGYRDRFSQHCTEAKFQHLRVSGDYIEEYRLQNSQNISKYGNNDNWNSQSSFIEEHTYPKHRHEFTQVFGGSQPNLRTKSASVTTFGTQIERKSSVGTLEGIKSAETFNDDEKEQKSVNKNESGNESAKSSKCNSPILSHSSNNWTQDMIPTRFVEVRQTKNPPRKRSQSCGRKSSSFTKTEVNMEPYFEKVGPWNSSVIHYADEGESHSGAIPNPTFRYSKRPFSGKKREKPGFNESSTLYTPKKVLSYCSVSPFQNPFIVRSTVEYGTLGNANFVPRNNLPPSTRVVSGNESHLMKRRQQRNDRTMVRPAYSINQHTFEWTQSYVPRAESARTEKHSRVP